MCTSASARRTAVRARSRRRRSSAAKGKESLLQNTIVLSTLALDAGRRGPRKPEAKQVYEATLKLQPDKRSRSTTLPSCWVKPRATWMTL
jgi:hypothetical protein